MGLNIYENLESKQLKLRAEEKWLLETLEDIKEERNRVQLETLRLESLGAKDNSKNKEPTITKESQPNVSTQTNDDIEIDNEEEHCNDEALNLLMANHSALRTMIEDILKQEEEEEEVEVEVVEEEEEEEDEEEEEEDDEHEEEDEYDEEDDDEDEDFDDILLDIAMLMFKSKMRDGAV